MANETNETEEKKVKKPSKTLPGLVFLVGLALIVGGVLMQVGWFGGNETVAPEPAASTEPSGGETEAPAEEEGEGESGEGEATEGDEGTADAGAVDFSIHDITDNEPIPVKQGENYTYGGSFAMIVTNLTVNCDDDGTCGKDGDKVEIKFSTADGKDYPLTLTPTENTQNLIDVPVSVEEWHEDYVVIKLTRE